MKAAAIFLIGVSVGVAVAVVLAAQDETPAEEVWDIVDEASAESFSGE